MVDFDVLPIPTWQYPSLFLELVEDGVAVAVGVEGDKKR